MLKRTELSTIHMGDMSLDQSIDTLCKARDFLESLAPFCDSCPKLDNCIQTQSVCSDVSGENTIS